MLNDCVEEEKKEESMDELHLTDDMDTLSLNLENYTTRINTNFIHKKNHLIRSSSLGVLHHIDDY